MVDFFADKCFYLSQNIGLCGQPYVGCDALKVNVTFPIPLHMYDYEHAEMLYLKIT